MLKKRKQHNLKLLIIALVIGLTCTLFASCREGATSYIYESDYFFLENDRGSYIYGELVMPKTDESCPLVFIAHGFKGTRNSGGAKELSERLASVGIAAVRIDFNGYTEDSLKSNRTKRYTLTDMQSDAVKTINYVIENYNIDGNRLGMYGRSMGGRVAMMLANENVGDFDFKAMTLIAPAGNSDAMIYYMGGDENWANMKEIAFEEGYCEKQGLQLTYDWFTDFEEYDPSKTGHKFGEKPVLLYYNTLDTVVRPVTSLECAAGYSNIETIEVTTEDGHGYEMGYEESVLKEKIMSKITAFFATHLEV